MSTYARDSSVKDSMISFLAVLDNEEVIEKIASTLSTSITLLFTEKMNPIIHKLDVILEEDKTLNREITTIEQDNEKLRQKNADILTSMDTL